MLSVNSLVAHGHRTISSRTLGHPEKLWLAFGDRTTALQKHCSTTCIWQFRVLLKGYIAWKVTMKHGSRMKLVEIQTFTPGLLLPVVNMLPNMAACLVIYQHCRCADITWWNLMNKLWKLCLGNTKVFTGQKMGRMVFNYFHFWQKFDPR